MRCKYCGAYGECFEGCNCMKCIAPEAYEQWKENNPDAYEEWLEKNMGDD